jgi:hypothetical protein
VILVCLGVAVDADCSPLPPFQIRGKLGGTLQHDRKDRFFPF